MKWYNFSKNIKQCDTKTEYNEYPFFEKIIIWINHDKTKKTSSNQIPECYDVVSLIVDLSKLNGKNTIFSDSPIFYIVQRWVYFFCCLDMEKVFNFFPI